MTETELMIVIITFFFSLPNQQRERPERGFEASPLPCRCCAAPVELSGQLGAGRYVARL